MKGVLHGVVVSMLLSLAAADSETAVSDPSKIFKPMSPRVEPAASSSNQHAQAAPASASLPSSSLSSSSTVPKTPGSSSPTEDGAAEAKSAKDGQDARSPDAYKLFPPEFHQFLDMPIHSYPNGTTFDKAPYDGPSTNSESKPGPGASQGGNEAPDYNYYDTGGPNSGSGASDSASHNNHQGSNNYRDPPTFSQSTNPSKDQSYANYVASLTNKNKFSSQAAPEKGYESHYEDDYENDYEGSYGSKVNGKDKKKPNSSKGLQYSPSSGTGPNDLPQVNSPVTKTKSSTKSSSGKSKLQSTSQQLYTGSNYYSDSDSSKPFKPSQPLSSNYGSQESKVPLYSQPANPSSGPKNHYQPSFVSGNQYNSPSSKKKPVNSKPAYAGPSSPSADASGSGSGPSADEESAQDAPAPTPKSRPGKTYNSPKSKPSYRPEPSEDSDYEQNDYEQSPNPKSPKSGPSKGSSRPAYNSPTGPSAYGPPFGQAPTQKPNQPLNTKYADGWKPIPQPSSGKSNPNKFKDLDDDYVKRPSGFKNQPSFDSESGKSTSESHGSDNEEEEESDGQGPDSPAGGGGGQVDYDYYNEDGPPSDGASGPPSDGASGPPSDGPSGPSSSKDQAESEVSEPSASGPAEKPSQQYDDPNQNDSSEPPRPNKQRPLNSPQGGKPPKFGGPKFGGPKFSEQDKGKDTSAPVADDFDFDEYASEPVDKKPSGQQGFRPGGGGPNSGRKPGGGGGRPFNDGPPFDRPGPGFGNKRPNQGKFNSPPGRQPGFRQQGGRPGGGRPFKNLPQSNEIADDFASGDFDDTPPPARRPAFGSRPNQGRPNGGNVRQRQQNKRPNQGILNEDPKNYEDSEEYDTPGPPQRRPQQGGRQGPRRPNNNNNNNKNNKKNRPLFNDEEEELFFGESEPRRPPKRRPNRRPLNNGLAGRQRPQSGEPAGGAGGGDDNTDVEAEGLQIPDDYYEDAALEAMADVLLDDLDLEDSENGAPPQPKTAARPSPPRLNFYRTAKMAATTTRLRMTTRSTALARFSAAGRKGVAPISMDPHLGAGKKDLGQFLQGKTVAGDPCLPDKGAQVEGGPSDVKVPSPESL